MITQQTLQQDWKDIQRELRSKWGSLTEHDLQACQNDVDKLVTAIQRKTGETRESIEQFFADLKSDGVSAIGRAGEAVRGYAHQAADAVQETSQQAAASVSEGYAEVEDLVRQRPAESLAVCFVAGMITGVVVSLLLQRR
jgi:ElaB/YqjD/DUF883 family membrane-anchored ribosome-binding protein